MGPADRYIASAAVRQHGLVTRPQLISAGVTDAQIEFRLRTGGLVALHRGVYRIPAVPPVARQAVLAACLASGGVASHRSAASLFSLRGFEREKTVEITVEGRRAPRLDGVIAHTTGELVRTVIGNIPVTMPNQTLLGLAHVEPRRAEGALNDALGRGLVRLPALVRFLQAAGRRKGVTRLQELVELQIKGMRPTESWLEDRVLEFLRARGFPEPVRQFRLRLPDGRTIRFDFAYPAIRRAVEADGRLWHTTPVDRRRDAERDRMAALMGWQVERVTWLDLEEQPADTAARLRGLRLAA